MVNIAEYVHENCAKMRRFELHGTYIIGAECMLDSCSKTANSMSTCRQEEAARH